MKKRLIFLILMAGLTFQYAVAQVQSLDKWQYIEADSSRQKWGDWNDPDWLRYFGLDVADINRDGYKDLVSGRYFYLNPGGDMEGTWKRSDLGMNADGYLFADVDGDELIDVIAEALPSVWWFEADDMSGRSWSCRRIGEIPATDHVNGQGGLYCQLVNEGNKEIILAAGDGVYAAEIPENPQITSEWKFFRIFRTGSSEGLGAGDFDGDGDTDIAAGDMFLEDKDVSRQVFWFENPGSLDKDWVKHYVGAAVNAADRIEVADFDGDGNTDIAVSEELWPGTEARANLLVFTNPGKNSFPKWTRKILFTGYSLNNLDAGDIDRDGDTDLVTCEHKGKEFRLLIFENDGHGNFTMHNIDKGHESHLGTRLADLDSDGDDDLVSIAWDNYRYMHIWRNDALEKEISWTHLSSKQGDLPEPNGGNEQTSCLVADLDKDGIKDFVITDRSVAPSVIWYRYIEGDWEKFIVDSTMCPVEAGSAALDIDKDGDMDIIFGGDYRSNEVWWWENPFPAFEVSKSWIRHKIKGSGANKHHDLLTGDFDGDGEQELVFWNQDAHTLFISEIPAKPRQSGEWKRKAVYVYSSDSEMEPRGGLGAYPVWRGRNEHEGLAKADIDGDGLVDIIGGGRWFKYLGNGEYSANTVDASFTFSRVTAGQFTEGGRPEIIMSTGDGTGPLIMYEWSGREAGPSKNGSGTWIPKILIREVYDGHTLDALDFDGDGHLDIFSAEMKLNPDNPGVIRILLGDGKGNFVHHIVNENIGCHEGKIFDLEGDGDFDILCKPYNWDAPRIDMFINDTR